MLSASRMLMVLDKKGNVVAYSGGSVPGGASVGLQAASTVLSAGSVYYGAKAISHGLENMHANVKSIPSNVNLKAGLKADFNANVSGNPSVTIRNLKQ